MRNVWVDFKRFVVMNQTWNLREFPPKNSLIGFVLDDSQYLTFVKMVKKALWNERLANLLFCSFLPFFLYNVPKDLLYVEI